MPKTQIVEAVYEQGVFRPLQELDHLPEQSHVRITVEWSSSSEEHPLLKFAGILNDAESQALKDTIKQEFGKIEPHDW